jgi:hypothetical protein
MFDSLVGSGTFRPDPRQRDLVSVLQELHEDLVDYEPEEVQDEGLLSKVCRKEDWSQLFSV